MKKIIVISNTVGREFSQSIKTTAVRYFEDYEVISLLTSHQCDYHKLIKKMCKQTKRPEDEIFTISTSKGYLKVS